LGNDAKLLNLKGTTPAGLFGGNKQKPLLPALPVEGVFLCVYALDFLLDAINIVVIKIKGIAMDPIKPAIAIVCPPIRVTPLPQMI
jgi:hypothetical protein